MRYGALLAVLATFVLGSVIAVGAGAQQTTGTQQGVLDDAPRPQAQAQLPDGSGKELVSAMCSRCHGLNMITNSWGYTKDGWEDRIATMITLPREQLTTVSGYLATHFPNKPVPGAVMIAGPASVRITEWLAPTLGSRPHDPLAAADGSIWWTGQFASKLGRVDPKSGALKEFSLPQGTQPHGLVEDKTGRIWYTGIAKNVIGRLDPKTGEVTEYPVQKAEPASRGPHTPIFDQRGTLWFTMQSGHVGRLNPATGEMKIVASPTGPGKSYPYGIQIDSKGTPWYVDFRVNKLASVNPETMQITEVALPHAESRPRRIAITADDTIWYTDYTRGGLGRYDPKTGAIKEWASPGGPRSQPYGIASVGNVLWYSEAGVRPNTLVRFDAATEKFQTWAIPSGGGVIRNMMRTPTGNLVLACSGVNRIALVEVSDKGTVNRTN